MTFGSLFSGIGGIDLGLERAGMECRWQVEIDPWCRRVLAKHWPDVARYEDVRDVGADNLEAVDLIAGGFPCQPFSLAGQRRGESDDRNLWPEMRRIVEDLRPRWVLAENVPGIISLYLDTVLSDLEALGYTTGAVVLPACAFDAPHIRQRLFIVANAASECRGARGAEPAGQQRQAGLAHGGAYVADAASIAQREPADQSDAIAVGRAAWHEPGHGSRNDAYTDREPLGWLTKPRQERGHWAVEPDVGGTPNGLPAWMDGGRVNAKTTETGAGEILQALRDSDGAQALRWWPTGRPGRVQATAVLQSALRESARTPEALGNLSLESEAASGRVLRGVWHDSTVACPPCERAARRQQAGEHPDALHILSSLLTCDCGATWLGRTGAYVSHPWSGDWEIGVPRVAYGIPDRVNRLRGLGNAVVPQVVEFIGRQIMEAS